MVFDHGLAAPAWGAAGQVGFAIAFRVEQGCQLGVLQLGDVGDVVVVGGFLIDQIALGGVADVFALALELGIAARIFIKVGVQRVPVRGDEGGIPSSNRHVGGGVVHVLVGLDGVAQLL